ncbi:MAG: hypothetical protein E4H01_14800 [Lysobacterales bacterium]|nr:MAG: hypothetical protein E4H01_14800 [Xanthomonadales bacterium]
MIFKVDVRMTRVANFFYRIEADTAKEAEDEGFERAAENGSYDDYELIGSVVVANKVTTSEAEHTAYLDALQDATYDAVWRTLCSELGMSKRVWLGASVENVCDALRQFASDALVRKAIIDNGGLKNE